MPSVSRSTLLQDLKKGFVSGSKKIKGEKSVTRKTSQLKISSTPSSTANTTKQTLERVYELDGSGSRPTKKGTYVDTMRHQQNTYYLLYL